jgi:hypothetical protein
MPSREITMGDYYAAMYTTNAEGLPRATMPKVFWDADTEVINVATAVPRSIIEDYNLYVQLYYYNPIITGAIGNGAFNLPAPDSDLYVDANVVNIPISKDLIYTFKEFKAVQKGTTAHDEWPMIVNGSSFAQNRNNLYNELQKYYDLYYVYEDTSDSSAADVEVKINWPTTVSTVVDTAGYVDYDNDLAEDEMEARTCTVTFLTPVSNELETVEWEFPYYMVRR